MRPLRAPHRVTPSQCGSSTACRRQRAQKKSLSDTVARSTVTSFTSAADTLALPRPARQGPAVLPVITTPSETSVSSPQPTPLPAETNDQVILAAALTVSAEVQRVPVAASDLVGVAVSEFRTSFTPVAGHRSQIRGERWACRSRAGLRPALPRCGRRGSGPAVTTAAG